MKKENKAAVKKQVKEQVVDRASMNEDWLEMHPEAEEVEAAEVEEEADD